MRIDKYTLYIHVFVLIFKYCVYNAYIYIWHMYFSFTCKFLVYIFPTSKLPIPALSSSKITRLRKPPATPPNPPKKTKPTKKPFHASCPSSTAAPPTPSNQLVVDPQRVQRRGFSRQILAPDIRELLGLPPPWQQIRVPWTVVDGGFWVKVEVLKASSIGICTFFTKKHILLGEFCFNM